MKHKLTIDVSMKSLKDRVVAYNKVSPDAKVKDLIGEKTNKVAIIVLRGFCQKCHHRVKQDCHRKQ